mgnify:CR=1 FL=1
MESKFEKEFEKETGKPSCIQKMWISDSTTMPSWDYVRWLESKLENLKKENERFIEAFKEIRDCEGPKDMYDVAVEMISKFAVRGVGE